MSDDEDRPLSYSRPSDVLEMLSLGFLTIEEGRRHYIKAGGNAAEFEAFVKQYRRVLVSEAD